MTAPTNCVAQLKDLEKQFAVIQAAVTQCGKTYANEHQAQALRNCVAKYVPQATVITNKIKALVANCKSATSPSGLAS